MKEHKILVIDDDETTRILLQTYLTKNGYKVVALDSAISGAELLRKESFSLVITDINMPEVSGLDFLLWIKKHNIDTQVIMITAQATKEIELFVNKKGALNFFKKPIDFKELNKLLDSLLGEKGFSGSIDNITLFDFIQMMILSSNEKRISVFEPNSGKIGYIYIKNNNIIHSEIENLTGEEAFYRIMKIKSGAFADSDWVEPEKQTITSPHNYLLMEAAKSIDDAESKNETPIQSDSKPFNKKILVVDDEPTTTKIIQAHFSKSDYQITITDSAVKGAEILRKELFGLVITDLYMPEINGLEFLLWIKANTPKTQVIIMTSETSLEIKSYASQSGALNYYHKPLNLYELDDFIAKLFIDKAFSGNVRDINLFDFIQIVSMSRKNKLISVNEPLSSKQGFLYLKAGNLIHAEFDNMQGEEAFFAITQLEKGIFSDISWIEPDIISIKSSLGSLLMKSMRLIDEKKNEEKIKAAMKNNMAKDDKSSSVKAEARFLERILAQKNMIEKIKNETDPAKKMIIYEFGVALEIAVGRSDKRYVIETMKKYSKVDAANQLRNNSLSYDDISVKIIFDEKNLVEEISFGEKYPGATNCGVSIGDDINKPLKLYGKPQLSTMRGYVWENIAFFVDSFNIIETIRLRTVEI